MKVLVTTHVDDVQYWTTTEASDTITAENNALSDLIRFITDDEPRYSADTLYATLELTSYVARNELLADELFDELDALAGEELSDEYINTNFCIW